MDAVFEKAYRAGEILISIVVTYLGLLLVTFLIARVIPVDPVLVIVGDRATPDVYQAAAKRLGLDQPLWLQFLSYVGGILHGDLGQSFISSRAVLSDLKRYFPATAELATAAILIGSAIGIPMGMIAAAREGRWPDYLFRVLGLIGYSVPVFWLGLMALLVFYAELGWSAGPGRLDIGFDGQIERITGFLLVDSAAQGEWEIFRNALSHLVLPASILGFFSLAYISRMTRSFMLDQLTQEYVITARVKGMPEWRIIWLEVFPNIHVQLITVVALAYGGLLEGAVLTESVFAWPGIGSYMTSSLLAADMNAVLGATILIGTIFVIINMLADLLYRLLDPRARRGLANT